MFAAFAERYWLAAWLAKSSAFGRFRRIYPFYHHFNFIHGFCHGFSLSD